MTHVAITGASSGIGEALAREYLRHGAHVTLVARRRENLERIASEAGGTSHIEGADLGILETCTDWIARAERALGPIDTIINNAGVQIVGPTEKLDPAACRQLLFVDLHAPLMIQHALLPAMLARKSGTIVNIASLAALAPTPGMTWYNAAKAGLAAASESLRGELLKSGVHVLTVYPGPVKTAMADQALSQIPESVGVNALPTGTPEELARRIRIAAEDREPRLIYPLAYTVARHTPGITRWLMDRLTPPFNAPDKP